ncbi:MAG: hypothetical protein FWE60_00980, partial [Oscillospiraceae bacterium]|nr:hypothetical protein [Oscillospiraceae bacterium]
RREVRKAVTPAFEGMLVVGSGQLRIQNITPPVEELILTPSFVEFWLTNPTRTPILGAEAFLYNDRGTQLSSIYISGVGENSSDRFELPFITGRTAGVYSYTLEIKYRDADGKPNEITRTFSVNVVTEKTDVEEGERPARIIIQRINNPAIMYLGVNTRVPYTIVNAGKGGAYNVEVYVVDAEGNELAREYVGNIPPAGSSVEEVEIKFDIESEHELTMYAIYENFNESRNQVTRSFTQRVIAYRASVTDVAGFEWLEVGMQTNIEFSILNNGSEVLRNTTAVLSDSEGNRYGELFIGTIEPGTIKERLRFRNIMFWEAGGLDLMITVTYENESMQTFSFETNFSTMVSEPWTPDFGDDWGDSWPEDDWGMEVDGEGGEAWWVLWLILGGLAVAGVVVLVVFVKKGARKRENDEMENFIKAMSGGDVQPIPEPAATHEYAYSVEASNNDEE